MKNFKVYDLYDGKITLGYTDTMQGVKKLARQEYKETDGECAIYYAELNKETMRYKFTDRNFLEAF